MRFIALGAAVVAAVGAYSAFWYGVARSVPPALAAWQEAERAKGREADIALAAVEGFPFRIVARVPRGAWSAPDLKGAPGWRGENITIVMQPWNLDHAIVRADGPQDFSWSGEGDDKGSGGRHQARVEADRAFASVVRRNGVPDRVAVDLEGARIATDLAPGPLAFGRLQFHSRHVAPEAQATGDSPARPASVQVALDGERLDLPAEWDAGLGRRVESFSLGLEVAGEIGEGPAREVAARWRDAGGTLEFRRIAAQWGRVALSGDGTLALDQALRPLGAFGLKVAGWEAAVDAAVAGGRLSDRAGRTAKSALSVLAVAGKDEEGRLPVPVSVQNGDVLLGPVAVAKVGPLF